MLSENHALVLLLATAVLIVLTRYLGYRRSRNYNELDYLLNSLKFRFITYGMAAIALWWTFPSATDFPLRVSHGFASLDEVQSFLNQQTQMLRRYADLSNMIVGTFVIFFLFDVYDLAKSIVLFKSGNDDTATVELIDEPD